MRICFSAEGWEDYLYWQKENQATLTKINSLIRDIRSDPSERGMGKAERLKGELGGYLSRRINGEHRLVYRISDDSVTVIQCRFHY